MMRRGKIIIITLLTFALVTCVFSGETMAVSKVYTDKWSKKYGSGWLSYNVSGPRGNIHLEGAYANTAESMAQSIAMAIALAAVGQASTTAVVGGIVVKDMAENVLSYALAIFDIKLLQSSDGSVDFKLEYVPVGMAKVQLVKNGKWYMTGFYPTPYMLWMTKIPIPWSHNLP
jgi:hypothetical protein